MGGRGGGFSANHTSISIKLERKLLYPIKKFLHNSTKYNQLVKYELQIIKQSDQCHQTKQCLPNFHQQERNKESILLGSHPVREV